MTSPSRRGLMLSALAASATPAWAQPGPRRVVIDTDPGVDDALSIFLALRSPELKVEAVTPVAGNAVLATAAPNVLRILEIAGRTDIPVATGAAAPLRRRLFTAAYAHGDNGLGGIPLPAPRMKASAEPAHAMIRRIVRAAPGEITLVALGPLTNVALAFRADPGLPRLLKGLHVMGGSLSGGNITPAAEFNFYCDPEAAQLVFRSGAPITMVGLDVTRKAAFSEAQIATLLGSATSWGKVSGQLMRAALDANRKTGVDGGQALAHDSMAMTSAIQPSLLTFADLHVEIETAGELTAGASLGYRKAPMRRSALLPGGPRTNELGPYAPNARVALDVDAPRFLDFLIGRLTRV